MNRVEVRYGEYRKGIPGYVWGVEGEEKGGAATVVLRVENANASGDPTYRRVPLWRFAALPLAKDNPGAPVAAVFVGVTEVRA